MSQIAVGVTVGASNTSAQVPITVSNLAALVTTAYTSGAAIVTAINAMGALSGYSGLTGAAAAKAAALATVNTTLGYLVQAQTAISSANVLVQSDTSIVANVATLNGALVSALAYMRDNNVIPV